MYPTISIRSLHLEYQLWVRELIFFKEEIKIFETHLEEIINRNSKLEVQAQVEHFQNQFIRQKEVIDEIRHKLHISEKQLAGFVSEISGMGLDSIKMDNHTQLREEVSIFKKIYYELKTDFRRFEAQWM